MKRARWLLYGAGLIVPCLLGAGCIPYVYPKLDYVPGSEPEPMATDVHAFRVDVSAYKALMAENGECTLTEITPRSDGSIPPQSRVTVEHGFVFINLPLGRYHAMHVRLYRPGYQLVKRNSWDLADKISWKPAPDWKAQEKVVDDLLAFPVQRASGNYLSSPFPLPPPSPEEKRALVFAAAEYERVAKMAPKAEDAERLRKKAQKLLEMKPATQPNSLPAPRPTAASKALQAENP
jgi:hypothetical protein